MWDSLGNEVDTWLCLSRAQGNCLGLELEIWVLVVASLGLDEVAQGRMWNHQSSRKETGVSGLQSSYEESPRGGPDSSTAFPGRSDQLSPGLALCRSSLDLARAAWAAWKVEWAAGAWWGSGWNVNGACRWAALPENWVGRKESYRNLSLYGFCFYF